MILITNINDDYIILLILLKFQKLWNLKNVLIKKIMKKL
jgi:hypothetical protein